MLYSELHAHTLQNLYGGARASHATARVNVANRFIIAVVDVKDILKARGIQAESGLIFDGQNADDMLHKILESFLLGNFKRLG